MATYLQGVTDYIPEIQEFKPDFNFYAKSLQMSQSKYDANHDKLSSLYGSLLNSPMLREDNIEARDQFFKTIEQDIKKMSGMDLSKQQNVDAASSVFNQMLDNNNIIKDMSWTKNWQKEHQRADGFRNCVDPEKCGGAWWEGGVNELNYRADEFKNASAEEAMNFGNARFTPYQDVMGKAIKLAKEANLNITVDEKKGGYIITTKNGKKLMEPLTSLFTGTLGRDPKIMDYYRSKAYVTRKGYIQSKVPEYGSTEAAEQAYIDEVARRTSDKLTKEQQNLEFTTTNTRTEKERLEEEIRTKGTTTGSPLADAYQDMVGQDEAYNSSLETVKEANGNMNVALSNRANKATLANLDNALAAANLQEDIGAAAYTLAFRDYEQTMKADPYALENVRQANRLSMEDVRFQNKKAMELYKFDLDQYGKQLDSRGNVTSNVPLMKDASVGNVDVSDDPLAAWNELEKDTKLLRDEISAPEKEIAVEAMKLTQSKSKAQGGLASQDLVRVMDAVMKEFADVGNYKEGSTVGQIADADPRYGKYKSMTKDQKLKFAQKFDFNKLEGLNGAIMDNLYNDEVLPMIDMASDKTNQASRDYLSDLWTSSAEKRDAIKNKNIYFDSINNWYADETSAVKAKMRSNPEFAPYIDMIDSLVDDHGNKKTREEFAKDYAENAKITAPPVSYMNPLTRQVSAEAPGYVERALTGGQSIQIPTNRESVYNNAYAEALMKYDGLEKEEHPILGGMISNAVIPGAGGLFDTLRGKTVLDKEVQGSNIYDIYKRGWSRYASPGGVPGYMAGAGSQAVEKQMVFPTVDPAEALSVATMGTNAYFKDILQADPESRRISLGGMAGVLPESGTTSGNLAIINQLYSDLVTRTNPKDKNRPIFNVSFQNIAGGDANWMALNIKIDDTYAKQFIGTEKNPGIFYDKRTALQTNGMTMYLKKTAATNMFYKNAEKTSIDNAIDWAGEIKIDDYPAISKNISVKRKSNGGVSLSGSILAGINEETGDQEWEPLDLDYPNSSTKVQDVVTQVRNMLASVKPGNEYLLAEYIKKHGIKDPQQLLNQ